jgi:hypothetical protein
MTNPSRAAPTSPQVGLQRPIPKVLALTPAQDVFVRQLGGAIVLHWDTLPDALQDLLIDQASVGPNGADELFTPALIEKFIRKAKTTAVRQLQKPESRHDNALLQTA